MTFSLSFHVIEDCETKTTLEVVLNNKTESPIGRIKLYGKNCVTFTYSVKEEEVISLKVLAKIIDVFYNEDS